MIQLFDYSQVKKQRNKEMFFTADLNMFEDAGMIHFRGYFTFDYSKMGDTMKLVIDNGFSINLKNGDITTTHQLNRGNQKNKEKISKNKFGQIFDIIQTGIYLGEKRKNFWGIRYGRACKKIEDILIEKLPMGDKNQFFKDKNHRDNYVISPLFDLLVDYHLERKRIKPHDFVYHLIQKEYPVPKWLNRNGRKYLPSVLDSYGIKTKYLIGELNQSKAKEVNIRSLNYICQIFGDNFIDHIKQIDWIKHCKFPLSNKKTHTLKNNAENRFMIQFINSLKDDKDTNLYEEVVVMVNKLLTIREFLESKGVDLKFRAKDEHSFNLLTKKWEGLRKYFKKGHRVRFKYPETFLMDIEEDIIVKGVTFKVMILKTEDEFAIEGVTMNNCMAGQFELNGVINTYVTLTKKNKRINLQYKRGNLLQEYGKSNSKVNSSFNEAVEILSRRFSHYSDVKWVKEKFDFIKNQ